VRHNGTVRPFLLIATRPEDTAAQGEYEAMLRFTGLTSEQVRYVQLDRAPLPEIDLEELSGVIVGGSPYTTSDPPQKKSAAQVRVEEELGGLLDRVVAADFPFFGACYGVGTLGVHEGAVVDTAHPEPVSAIDVTLTGDGIRDPLIREARTPSVFSAYVGHKEAISSLPHHAVLLATGAVAPVQMFRIGTCQYATQFHPELDNAGIVDRVRIYRDNGYYDPPEVDALIARLEAADVGDSHDLLRAFVALHAR
jgi:GMP synthase (glutamine-hydrolysing)